MARINSIDYTRFGNENYLSFSREFCTFIQQFAVIGQRFGYLTTAYLAAVEELDDAMKKQTWSDLTKPIADKDEARDKVLMSLKALIEAYRHYSPIEGLTDDAEKVYRFIRLNHVNPAAQYDKETAQISNLLQDLERYCQAEVERMSLNSILVELGKLNDEVAALIAERDIQDSLKKNEAVKQARRKCDLLYVALKDTVNGAAQVDYEGVLTPFIDAVNQMIKRLEVQVLKVPGTAGSNGSDETVETPGETEPGENTPGESTPDEGGEETTPPAGGDNNTGGGSGDNNTGGGSTGGDNTGGSGSNGGSTGGGNTPPDSGNTGEDQPF